MATITLKKIGDDIRARLKAAEKACRIPGREPGGYRWVRYDVRVSNSKKNGPAVNITINGYEWLIPGIEEGDAYKRWAQHGNGAKLIAFVDEIAARERFTSADGSVKVGGVTKLGVCIASARVTSVTHVGRDGTETVEHF